MPNKANKKIKRNWEDGQECTMQNLHDIKGQIACQRINSKTKAQPFQCLVKASSSLNWQI